MKYIILVGDGMGDLPLQDLGNRTPLEIANTPAMDSLSRNGELFRLRTIPEGMQPGSDIANLSLLGYEPQDFYTGRAPLEAASMGIELAADETAYRCNLVNLEKTGPDSLIMVDFSAGHIPTADAGILISGLQKELGSDLFHFYAGISYRHLMISKNNLPSLATVPPHDYIGKNVAEYWKRYLKFPELQHMLESACRFLESHPVNEQRRLKGQLAANAIWLWGEGKAPTIPTIGELFGLQGKPPKERIRGGHGLAGHLIKDLPLGHLLLFHQGNHEALADLLQDVKDDLGGVLFLQFPEVGFRFRECANQIHDQVRSVHLHLEPRGHLPEELVQ